MTIRDIITVRVLHGETPRQTAINLTIYGAVVILLVFSALVVGEFSTVWENRDRNAAINAVNDLRRAQWDSAWAAETGNIIPQPSVVQSKPVTLRTHWYALVFIAGVVVAVVVMTMAMDSSERKRLAASIEQGARLLDNNARILYAEDSADDVELMVYHVFEPLGLRPVVVGDGESAIRLVRKEGWDLVILDMRLPVANGADIFRALRAQEVDQTHKTPVIVTTGFSGGPEMEALYDIGAPTFFKKPLNYQELRSFIQRLCYA